MIAPDSTVYTQSETNCLYTPKGKGNHEATSLQLTSRHQNQVRATEISRGCLGPTREVPDGCCYLCYMVDQWYTVATVLQGSN